MNLPNKLTITRTILVIPFIIILSISFAMSGDYSYKNLNKKSIMFFISWIIFLIGMITDYLDGHIARKKNIITTFGKLFDPIADKLLTSSALIILSIEKIVPSWITIIFILRDILVNSFRNLLLTNKLKINTSKWGKIKTMMLTISILIIFIIYPIKDFKSSNNKLLLNIPLMIAMIVSIYSGYKYFQNVIPLIKNK